jgi:hypothetical protein
LSSPADDGYVLERLFKDDVNIAMHVVGISYPPQVQPICV